MMTTEADDLEESKEREFLRRYYRARSWRCVPRQLCVGVADALQGSLESCSLGTVSKKKRWISLF